MDSNHGELDRVTPSGRISRVIDISASVGHVVPTALTHRGAIYIANLGVFEPTDGAGDEHVWQLTGHRTLKERATGVEKVLGLAFRGGQLYALEMSTTAGAPTPGTGGYRACQPARRPRDGCLGLDVPDRHGQSARDGERSTSLTRASASAPDKARSSASNPDQYDRAAPEPGAGAVRVDHRVRGSPRGTPRPSTAARPASPRRDRVDAQVSPVQEAEPARIGVSRGGWGSRAARVLAGGPPAELPAPSPITARCPADARAAWPLPPELQQRLHSARQRRAHAPARPQARVHWPRSWHGPRRTELPDRSRLRYRPTWSAPEQLGGSRDGRDQRSFTVRLLFQGE